MTYRHDVPASYSGVQDELIVDVADEHVYASLDGDLGVKTPDGV